VSIHTVAFLVIGLFFAGLAIWLQYQKHHSLYRFEDMERFADEATAISSAFALLCFVLSYFA